MENKLQNWLAPESSIIPDFIICGAMKAGTTTLHHILNHHPHVFIPQGEIHFFDIDNILQHPDFSFFCNGEWVDQNIDENPSGFWNWYNAFFKNAARGQLIGEDSTTYIASERAAQRIALQEKQVKIVVSLRHPTARAYSQYWHYVVSGRTTYSFEDTIRYAPWSILQRSLYCEQLSNFLKYIPRHRIKIVIFEEFLMDKEKVIADLCDFLEIDFNLMPQNSLNLRANKTMVPKHNTLQLFKNRIFREIAGRIYATHLPKKPVKNNKSKYDVVMKQIEKLHRKMNPLTDKGPPKMNPSTKKFLDGFFKEELRVLNGIAGKEVLSFWNL